MTNATVSQTVSTAATTSVAAPAITFTVKDKDTVVASIAKIKRHPDAGLLVVIAGNPMAFLPTALLAGKNDAEKTARRSALLAAPGSEITVAVTGEPKVEMIKGKAMGRIKVSEQRVVNEAEKAERTAKAAARIAAIQASLEALVPGTIVEGTFKNEATMPSNRNDGTIYTYGAFIEVAPEVTGLLLVKDIEGGHGALKRIIAAGKVTVEVVESSLSNGIARVQLSQKSVAAKAFFIKNPAGKTTRGKVVKVGQIEGDLHGRILKLDGGQEVFLADDDTFVKSESALARGNTTRVTITGDLVGSLPRVTRKGL